MTQFRDDRQLAAVVTPSRHDTDAKTNLRRPRREHSGQAALRHIESGCFVADSFAEHAKASFQHLSDPCTERTGPVWRNRGNGWCGYPPRCSKRFRTKRSR